MHAALPHSVGQIDLRQIETALLDALLDVGSDGGNAVDRLLSDPKLSPNGREHVKRFLAAAVMDTGADRNRLLDEMMKSAPVV